MKKGDMVELNMYKMLCGNKDKDHNTYFGTVQEYHIQNEELHVVLQEANLTELSLDAIYLCAIHSAQGNICCTGRVKERYRNESGKTLVFNIDNGFYKINGN